MNINFLPSLQHLTSAKIAITLCNDSEIKALLKENRNLDPCKSGRIKFDACIQGGDYWSMFERSRNPRYLFNEYLVPYHDASDDILKQIQNMVCCMISPLKLGIHLEKKVLSFIPHIALEIGKWEEGHSKVLPAEYDAQVYFCWKSVGTIDRESTAENLLNNGNFSVKNNFFLACLYSMQNRLPSLWNSLSDSYKAHLISKCHSGSLLDYWTTCLDGYNSRRHYLPDALFITNVSTLHYFYNEYGNKAMKQALLNNVLDKQWKNLDLVHFCVSKLCQNGLEELSSIQCRYILRCCLNWPLQNLFLDMSELLLTKLDQFSTNDLLHDIFRIANTHHYEDIDYLNLLKVLWEQIPLCHKDFLMSTPDFQPIKAALELTSSK